jgi:rod shape-determining protein MreC
MAVPDPQHQPPSKAALVLLLLACFTLITLDARGGDGSPVDPVRAAVGEVFGPAESVTAAVVRPITAVPQFFTTTGSLRSDVARLEAENAHLKGQLATTSAERNRAAELDGLLASSKRSGRALVPARVVAMGPAQSFSRTVTIDAGTSSGVHPDQTVLNNDGLVGRVIRADRHTATVLLVVDQESVVGGRLGSNLEVGFLRGRGQLGDQSRLDLDLVDGAVAPERGDVLVSWGSRNDAPYVAGVPIGVVESVYSSPRQLSKQAVIRPFVDFSSLDLVGVVVDAGTTGDRAVIKAGAIASGEDD